MKVLVTGATGFLGQEVLKRLPDGIAACRSPEKLVGFIGEVRVGDLRDPHYREAVVQGVDAVVHCGTWSSLWGHAQQEADWFYHPTLELISACRRAGVSRFLLPSTVSIAKPSREEISSRGPTAPTGFWPHLDYLVALDEHMQQVATAATGMVTLRLGHFVGPGNTVGLVPALVPRLRTHLVPWLGDGTRRMPLVGVADLADGIVRAATAQNLEPYESFQLCGPEFPTTDEVFSRIAACAEVSPPWFRVPYSAAMAFGWLMERVPLRFAGSPFLTQSIVHLARDWYTPSTEAERRLGYAPTQDWRELVAEAVAQVEGWTALTQATDP